MLELAILKNGSTTTHWDMMTEDEKRTYSATVGVTSVIYLIFFIWALVRASQQKNKPLHMLFALVSPVFYLVFSYFVEDFNN